MIQFNVSLINNGVIMMTKFRINQITVKLWVLAILLSITTYLNYLKHYWPEFSNESNKGIFIAFVLFIILGNYFFKSNKCNYTYKWHSLFYLAIFFLNMFWLMTGHFEGYSVLSASLDQLFILLLAVLALTVLQPQKGLAALNYYYAVAFIIGFVFMSLTFLGVLQQNEILNENLRGFLMAPYLIYLLIILKRKVLKAAVYILGCLLLLYSGANTTLLAFVILPFWMLIVVKLKQQRYIYMVYLIIGITATYMVAYADSQFITNVLSKRDILWHAYFEKATSSWDTIFMGTKTWGIENTGIAALDRLNAHNTFLNYFSHSGIIALSLYLLFMIFGIRKTVNHFTVSDGVLFLAVTFQFLESNVPLLSFTFPVFIFLANILLNKESES